MKLTVDDLPYCPLRQHQTDLLAEASSRTNTNFAASRARGVMGKMETAHSMFCTKTEVGRSTPSRNSPGTVKGVPNTALVKKDKRQMKEPIGASQASKESCFQRTLKILDPTITLRMKTHSC